MKAGKIKMVICVQLRNDERVSLPIVRGWIAA